MAARLFPAVGPMLLISMGYIDPGKWSAVVEGGARFGHHLLLLIFLFNCAAILCQYLAARVTVVTEKNLAQICGEEYSKSTCILLAIQAEVSVIILDLTMILGIAHGFNLLFGLNLFTCVLFTASDIVLFPLFTTLFEKRRAEFVLVSIAGFVLASYVFGVLFSQPEIPTVMSGMLTRFSGESVFTLMSLLGANIMPHNFYVHSSIILQQKGPANASKRDLCHDHFFAILCIFSGIYMVNYVLMNSAATVFHSAGLVVLTFQDIFLLMDQVFRSPIGLFFLFLIMLISSHITSLTWNLGGQVVLHELLSMDTPVWIHRAAIRMVVISFSLYATWNSGAERIYQLLVFTQVLLAMMLPSSVIPLFRVASSRSIMGIYKISLLVEFLALIGLIGMLCLNIIFVVELLFGHSEWVGDFWWNLGSGMSLPYIVLLMTAFASLIFMLWLAATPLKSATIREDTHVWDRELQRAVSASNTEEKGDASGVVHQEERHVIAEGSLEKFVDAPSGYSLVEHKSDLPDRIINDDQVLHLPPPEENHTCQSTLTTQFEAVGTIELVHEENSVEEVADVSSKDDIVDKIEASRPLGEAVEVEPHLEKDEDQGDVWESEESYREVLGPSSTSDGPGSFRSISGKSDEGGNGPGSSRLSGLGRAARRQLAAILDEFWGQLYDFHGQATKEAKAKQLDVLFGLDPRPSAPSLKVNPLATTSSGYFPSLCERGVALPFTSNVYDSSKQQKMLSSVESPYGFQTGSSLWSADMPYVDGYLHKSSASVQDLGEKRYSSLRLPPSSESWDYQPATVHGYQLASYLSRTNTDRSCDPLNALLDSPTSRSPSFLPASYKDPLPYSFGQNSQSMVSTVNTSAYSPVIPRTSRLQIDKPCYDPCSYGPGETVGSPGCTKKYHSLPDISGLAVPRRDSSLVDRISRWNGPPGFPSVSKTTYERSLHSNFMSRAGVGSAYDELSSSERYKDAFAMHPSMDSDTKSLWSRQPFEQLFGVISQHHDLEGDLGRKPRLVLPRSTTRVDSETELLKSLRYCIMKLLKLEGCDWLFKQNGGADEDLIDRLATSEKLHYEAESRDINQVGPIGDSQSFSSDRKYGATSKIQDTDLAKFLVSSISYCGEGCIWQVDLIVSFGVWCIHRILELSLMESRPELWGKYTYVLNRLQGILEPAFSRPRSPLSPCFCLQTPATNVRKSSPPPPNGQLPPTPKPGKGKCTTASTVLEIIKDVEIAVSCRKGRTGTAAGDVAFPKGKENLASVLKRYKRRLSSKSLGIHEGGPGSRKVPQATSHV